ncbi:unnamed protein product, partial [Medioppia subpectinata]
TALCMLVGILIFPAGWDASIVREVCGNEADNYGSGQCGIRWAFILAIIGVVDCMVLSILAFVLGTRYVKLLPDQYLSNGSTYKGEVNSAFMADSGSRKSLHLQPVVMMSGAVAEAERFSEYSHRTGRSHKSNGFHHSSTFNNFQL